jgi:Calcineurin-like phosphoesterase
MPVDPEDVLEVLRAATEENQLSPFRQHQVVHLPAEGELWMTGDLHDHRSNFNKLISHADLAKNPQRHLILHELIHGDYVDANGAEDSWQTLTRAAVLKCDFPKQAHFLLANHDLAQIHGEGISKMGLNVCEAFNAGIRRDFGEQATAVTVAITEFLLSCPLAVRTENGLFCCHSLPTDEWIAKFDFSVFDRALKGEDYRRKTGPVYQLIWGRGVTPAGVAVFAERVGAKIIITGHQPQESGYFINGPQHLILASDHSHGVVLPIDLTKTYDVEELEGRIQYFAELE